MRVTCICVCHDKPEISHEAIGSIVNQTYSDWEALIVDSGVLYDAGYYDTFAWHRDPRIKLIRSHETQDTRCTKAMAPWCFNECFRRGLVTGELVVYLCDDDLLYSNAFETFASYCRRHPDAQAMYASQDIGAVYPNGWHAITGERRAKELGGRSCHGRRMDCEVDYLQFCHRADVLKHFPDDEYWPEAKSTEEHADGIFMERVGALVPIHPIDVKVSQNRRTVRSANIRLPSLGLLDCMANGVPLLPGREMASPSIEADINVDQPRVTIAIIVCDGDEMLPTALAAVESQTYPRREVIVIVGESTEPSSIERIRSLKSRYPEVQFVQQEECGFAAMRNHALSLARGDCFIPIEVQHCVVPDAIERMVSRMRTKPRLSAVTCYSLGVRAPDADRLDLSFQASVKNVIGSALFRTADLRAVGGYDLKSDAGSAEWSVFFRLVNAGHHVDILPEHLFWRAADEHNSKGMPAIPVESLNPFVAMDRVLAAEREALWIAMAGYERRLAEMALENRQLQARLELLRYRIADRVYAVLARLPFVVRGLKWLFRSIGKLKASQRNPIDKKSGQESVEPAFPSLCSAAKNASAAL